jgi:NAD(P)-dependent dehydrogenase (short-subunit alcohol dehydrogenase family)
VGGTGVLAGKTALVTGGGTGIGLSIAQRFFEEGALVAICGRRRGRLEAAARQLEQAEAGDGRRALAIPADLTRPEECSRVVAAVVEAAGGLDVLVNNAGVMRFGPLAEASPAQWEELMRINAWAPWRLMAEALPVMKRGGGGSIVNISSLSGLRPNAGSGLYCASKAALQMLSQVMALEAAPSGIRVNVICPGMVEDTELGHAVFGADNVAAFYPRFAPLHPLQRNGKPADIAEAALFLASEASSWVTGALLPVDGGRHLSGNQPARE